MKIEAETGVICLQHKGDEKVRQSPKVRKEKHGTDSFLEASEGG